MGRFQSLFHACVLAAWAAHPGAAASAAEPALSLVIGGSRSAPFGPENVHGDWGTRIGLGFASALHADDLRIPLEWGLSLRTASIGYDGWFNRDVFTDVQMPLMFHGPLGWKRLEILALWIPGYTLDMSSTSEFAGQLPQTETLRTRFNMGLGAGLQLVLPLGLRLRGHWVYNLFSPFPASRMTWSDFNFEAALPLAWGKGES